MHIFWSYLSIIRFPSYNFDCHLILIKFVLKLIYFVSNYFLLYNVPDNGIDEQMISHIWNLKTNFVSNFSFHFNTQITIKSFYFLHHSMSFSHPFSSLSYFFSFFSFFPLSLKKLSRIQYLNRAQLPSGCPHLINMFFL